MSCVGGLRIYCLMSENNLRCQSYQDKNVDFFSVIGGRSKLPNVSKTEMTSLFVKPPLVFTFEKKLNHITTYT